MAITLKAARVNVGLLQKEAARMVGKQHFTRRDKKMLLAYLGVDMAMVDEWFPEEVDEGNDQGGQDALLPMPNVRRIS